MNCIMKIRLVERKAIAEEGEGEEKEEVMVIPRCGCKKS